MKDPIDLRLVGMEVTLWARAMSHKPDDFQMGEEITLETEFGFYTAEVTGIAGYGVTVLVKAKGGSKS